MLCKGPYVTGDGQAYGCGQCLPCRLNRRRVWMHRIILEALQYTDNTFCTLTYNELPTKGEVNPVHTQKWLKRFRKAIDPLRIRYFIVGEYGDETQRPHYHAALFNYPTCLYGSSRYNQRRNNCCVACDTIRDTWGLGHTLSGTLTPESAAYIAGYVTKKMTNAGDERLNGRHPEFARMSLRPGVGGDSTWEIADAVLQWGGNAPDVPTQLRHGSKLLPLGRYLTRRLRAQTGREINAPKETIEAIKAEMLDVRVAAEAITAKNPRVRRWVMKDLLIQKNQGRIDAAMARARIFKQRKSI